MAMNKKADSRYVSPWFFLVLGLIAVAIAVGVFAFFSGGVDIRTEEARILSDKLISGISDNGYIKEDVIGGGFDILENSKISSKSMDNTGYFYFNVSIYKNDKLEKEFLKGNGDFEIQCRLNGDKLAKCYYREITLTDKKNLNMYNVKILTGSNNLGGNQKDEK